MKRLLNILRWLWKHSLEHLATSPIVSLINFILLVVGAWLLDTIASIGILNYLVSHPGRTVFTILILSLAATVIYRGSGYLKIYIRNREILAAVGVSGFWDHSKDDSKRSNWNSCKEKISANHPNELRILGVTGWETFGKPGSPLHDLVQSFRGEIRILLIKPGCNAFRVRARALGINESDYEKEITDTISVCESLRGRGKSIIVKLYEQTPIWKMIFTENYLWLQYYKPDDHVDNTPVYTLFANDDETSLYFPLIDVFRKRWDYDKNTTVVKPALG